MIKRSTILTIAISAAIMMVGCVLGSMFIARQVPQGQMAFDVNDKRRLVGDATHVFEGRVIKRVGSNGIQTSVPGDVIPQSQYSVEVLESIKGDAMGTIIVSQYDNLEGDTPLKSGQRYIFVTKYNPETAWYHTTAGRHSNIHVKDERSRNKVVDEFKKAHQEEIYPGS